MIKNPLKKIIFALIGIILIGIITSYVFWSDEMLFFYPENTFFYIKINLKKLEEKSVSSQIKNITRSWQKQLFYYFLPDINWEKEIQPYFKGMVSLGLINYQNQKAFLIIFKSDSSYLASLFKDKNKNVKKVKDYILISSHKEILNNLKNYSFLKAHFNQPSYSKEFFKNVWGFVDVKKAPYSFYLKKYLPPKKLKFSLSFKKEALLLNIGSKNNSFNDIDSLIVSLEKKSLLSFYNVNIKKMIDYLTKSNPNFSWFSSFEIDLTQKFHLDLFRVLLLLDQPLDFAIWPQEDKIYWILVFKKPSSKTKSELENIVKKIIAHLSPSVKEVRVSDQSKIKELIPQEEDVIVSSLDIDGQKIKIFQKDQFKIFLGLKQRSIYLTNSLELIKNNLALNNLTSSSFSKRCFQKYFSQVFVINPEFINYFIPSAKSYFYLKDINHLIFFLDKNLDQGAICIF